MSRLFDKIGRRDKLSALDVKSAESRVKLSGSGSLNDLLQNRGKILKRLFNWRHLLSIDDVFCVSILLLALYFLV